MGKIKNWKRTKYRSPERSMWINTLPEYKSFHDNFYVTAGRVGMEKNEFFVEVIKGGRQIRISRYESFADAKAAAMRYMRSFKNG